MKEQKGITLIALVVTIVVLIILATISINAVLGEDGLIKKAQQAKEVHANAVAAEEEAMNLLLQQYENAMKDPGSSEGDNTIVTPPTPPEYQDEALAATPKVAEGMQKVKYNSSTSKWEKVTEASEEWYNYENKQWANVVLPAEGTLDSLFNSDGTLNEDKKYVQLVWIPRFAYKITSQYHTGGTGAGNIEVVFIDTANQNKSKTKTYSTTYPSATAGASSGMSDYVVHPAFEYGGTHLPGFWMGKFESSHTGCTQTASTGQASYTGNEVIMVKPNVTSWRSINVNDIYNTCLNMNKSGNPYGLSTSDSVVDPHMAKNDEWGAVAYLSKSKYGKQTEEVFINNNSNFITGIAGDTASAGNSTAITNTYKTAKGIKASTNRKCNRGL